MRYVKDDMVIIRTANGMIKWNKKFQLWELWKDERDVRLFHTLKELMQYKRLQHV